jgi:hypothetical protein
MFDFRNFYQRYRLLARGWSQGRSSTNQQLAAQLGASIDIISQENNLYQRVKDAHWRGRLCTFYLGSTLLARNVPQHPPPPRPAVSISLYTKHRTRY